MSRFRHTIALLSVLYVAIAQAQPVEYEYGKNVFLQLGLDLNSLYQNKPTAGKGESQLGLGLFADMRYVHQKYKSVWESDANLAFSLQKSGSDPINKGNDEIRLETHYAFTTSYSSNWYTAADFSLRTQFANAYNNGAISDPGDTLTLQSTFAAPLRMELSVGEEYRIPQSPIYFFGGVAVNYLYVANDSIAAFPAMDRDGAVIGSLHGNPLDGKSLTQAGLTFKAQYQGYLVEDKLSYDTDFNFFVDLLKRDAGFAKDNSPIDILWNNNLSYLITSGISLSLRVDVLYDKDVVFVDDSDGNSNSDDFTKDGVSINSNFLLSLRKSFGNDK